MHAHTAVNSSPRKGTAAEQSAPLSYYVVHRLATAACFCAHLFEITWPNDKGVLVLRDKLNARADAEINF